MNEPGLAELEQECADRQQRGKDAYQKRKVNQPFVGVKWTPCNDPFVGGTITGRGFATWQLIANKLVSVQAECVRLSDGRKFLTSEGANAIRAAQEGTQNV